MHWWRVHFGWKIREGTVNASRMDFGTPAVKLDGLGSPKPLCVPSRPAYTSEVERSGPAQGTQDDKTDRPEVRSWP